jgi:hypothetical protein
MIVQPNKITGVNAGGPRRLPIWTRWAANIAQFCRWATSIAELGTILYSAAGASACYTIQI